MGQPQPGIYSITSTLNSKIYIGSSKNMVKRWEAHRWSLRRGKHPNTHLQAHVNKYGLGDLVFEIMEVEPDQTLRLGLEQLLVTALYGPTCFNQEKLVSVPPDNTGKPRSPETCAKISAAKKGGLHTPETKAKISASKKGTVCTEAHRAKLSVAGKGKTLTDEHRAKLSASSMGKVLSPETRKKIGLAGTGRTPPNKGVPCTPETKAKISAGNKGKVCSAEHRAKTSASNKGKKRTPETRARMSAARMGTTPTPETRAKMSLGQKARAPASPETREKLSLAIKLSWERRRANLAITPTV